MRLSDDRYGYPGSYELLECNRCCHRFINSTFTSGELTNIYSNYYPRSTFDPSKRRIPSRSNPFSAWLNGERSSAIYWVPSGSRVLDIGCGFGESLDYFRNNGCEAHGVEADENIRRVAEKFGHKVEVGLFDEQKYQASYFDAVVLNQVLEHAANPVVMMQGVASILKPGGIVVISTPNAFGWGARFFRRRWINWHTPYHLQLFSRRSLEAVSNDAGLLVEKAITLTNSAWMKYQWAHCVTFPRQGVPSAFWSPHVKPTTWERVALLALAVTHRTRISHLVTRLLDAFGVGDNYVVILRKPA
jgi:2-polyprenyl-3-methyl-5-hydroxy-6-metoxy-1,4-benzoquinol methylase